MQRRFETSGLERKCLSAETCLYHVFTLASDKSLLSLHVRLLSAFTLRFQYEMRRVRTSTVGCLLHVFECCNDTKKTNIHLQAELSFPPHQILTIYNQAQELNCEGQFILPRRIHAVGMTGTRVLCPSLTRHLPPVDSKAVIGLSGSHNIVLIYKVWGSLMAVV